VVDTTTYAPRLKPEEALPAVATWDLRATREPAHVQPSSALLSLAHPASQVSESSVGHALEYPHRSLNLRRVNHQFPREGWWDDLKARFTEDIEIDAVVPPFLHITASLQRLQLVPTFARTVTPSPAASAK